MRFKDVILIGYGYGLGSPKCIRAKIAELYAHVEPG